VPKADPFTVVPLGAVTGTLIAEVPVLVTVTVPFCTDAVTVRALCALAHELCRASVCASVTSVIWTSGVVVQLLYWLSMLLISVRIV
jgi:hypothetical protein